MNSIMCLLNTLVTSKKIKSLAIEIKKIVKRF